MTKAITAIRSLDPHAAESVIHFSMQALADYVCATNLPSLTANLRADMDDHLRRLYRDVFDVDLLDPAGQEVNHIEDPEFVRDLFCLKLNQGGGGFRPYAFRFNFLNAMNNAVPQMLNSTCSKSKRVTPGFFDFLSEWIGEGSFDRDKEKEKMRWKLFFEQRGQSNMATELHSEIARAKLAWMDALQALGEDPSRKPHCESPISVDHVAFGLGVKKLQKAICDEVKILRAKVMDMRAVALPKDDQRRIAYLSRRNDNFARQLLFGCPDNRVPFKPLEFQVAVQRAFGVPLTFIKAITGRLVHYGDKNEHSFIVDRYGNRIMTQTKCKGDHTRTLHNAFQAAVTVSLNHCGIPFKAASKWNKQTKGMLGNLLDPIERACDAARTPREKGAKKRQINGIIPDLILDVRNAIFNQLISYTTPTWFDQVETICDVKTLSPHDSSGYFSIADTDSVKPIDKRARKVHSEYTKAAQILDKEYYPDTPPGSMGPVETFILRHGPSATHPRAHEVTGFGVGAFGELSAECSELCNLVARVQAVSYMAYYDDKTPKEAFDAQRPQIRRFWGLTTQVGWARLIIERCTKFISSGDSESPVTAPEVDHDAETFDNYHSTNPDHGQGVFASSWRAGSEQD